jgi:hypothetical protein
MLRTGWLRTFERLERGTAFRLRVGLCDTEFVHKTFGAGRDLTDWGLCDLPLNECQRVLGMSLRAA